MRSTGFSVLSTLTPSVRGYLVDNLRYTIPHVPFESSKIFYQPIKDNCADHPSMHTEAPVIIIAKINVSLIMRLSIPRLEFCGAQVHAELLHHVRK